MNNEIILPKPRCWHKEREEYFNVIEINYEKEQVCISNGIFRISAKFCDVSLEWPSPIIDKNGNTVYQNDIVRYKYCAGACDYDQLSIITLPKDSTGFVMEPIGGGLWAPLSSIPGGHMKGFEGNKNHLFEIKGNIRQNEELLKSNKILKEK